MRTLSTTLQLALGNKTFISNDLREAVNYALSECLIKGNSNQLKEAQGDAAKLKGGTTQKAIKLAFATLEIDYTAKGIAKQWRDTHADKDAMALSIATLTNNFMVAFDEVYLAPPKQQSEEAKAKAKDTKQTKADKAFSERVQAEGLAPKITIEAMASMVIDALEAGQLCADTVAHLLGMATAAKLALSIKPVTFQSDNAPSLEDVALLLPHAKGRNNRKQQAIHA